MFVCEVLHSSSRTVVSSFKLKHLCYVGGFRVAHKLNMILEESAVLRKSFNYGILCFQ